MIGGILSYLQIFMLFFSLIAFVVTCTLLLFGSSVSLSEEDVRTFAPAVFFNIIVLTILFTVVDSLRRHFTVNRPADEIQKVLRQLMKGNFGARISIRYGINKENRFDEIAESINLLAEELSGVETLKTDFVANVSHELKTPLAVMQNYGTLLQAPDLSAEKRMEYARSVTEASRRLATLITNILRLNRLENQQIYSAAEKYNLSEQICECLLGFEDVWEKKNLVIETEIEDDITISSDPELLSIVWNNLFSNAIKFTDEGGTVAVSLTRDGSRIVMKVRDSGCGMTPEVGAHIFEKFYQGDTSHASAGNGLGLALVKKVVDIMHGEISVESVYGEGSTFTVVLNS